VLGTPLSVSFSACASDSLPVPPALLALQHPNRAYRIHASRSDGLPVNIRLWQASQRNPLRVDAKLSAKRSSSACLLCCVFSDEPEAHHRASSCAGGREPRRGGAAVASREGLDQTDKDGFSPFHAAASSGSAPCLKLLISYSQYKQARRASCAAKLLLARDSCGRTPLLWAAAASSGPQATTGHIEVMRMLLANGSVGALRLQLTASDSNGDTALSLSTGCAEATQLLLQAGQRAGVLREMCSSANNDGFTAWELAKLHNHHASAELLQEAGAGLPSVPPDRRTKSAFIKLPLTAVPEECAALSSATSLIRGGSGVMIQNVPRRCARSVSFYY
jgi:hypothetical protein